MQVFTMDGGFSLPPSRTGNRGIVEIAYGIFGPWFQYQPPRSSWQLHDLKALRQPWGVLFSLAGNSQPRSQPRSPQAAIAPRAAAMEVTSQPHQSPE